MVIVDAHCHAWPYWYEPIESALDSMIRNGVDKALLMPLAEGVDSHNTYQIECMRRFPGRFSVIATVDPHRPEAPERLEEWAEQGAEGVRLNPADPLAIWQKAGELGLVVNSAPGITPKFLHPEQLVYHKDSLYVSDLSNTIRRIDISTEGVNWFVGSGVEGHADGTGDTADLSLARGLAVDVGNLYYTDDFHILRKIDLVTRRVITVAGLAENADFVDGTGSAARFRAPKGLAIVLGAGGSDHQLYVVDSGNHSIREVE